jgi:hypothetical protein
VSTTPVISQENIESIALLKLDAELADWEVLNGVKAQYWQRIRQVAMQLHLEPDLMPISQFFCCSQHQKSWLSAESTACDYFVAQIKLISSFKFLHANFAEISFAATISQLTACIRLTAVQVAKAVWKTAHGTRVHWSPTFG